MTPNQVFSLLNWIAMCGWLLLILLPRRRWVADTAAGVAVPALGWPFGVGLFALWRGGWGGRSAWGLFALRRATAVIGPT
jgi:hypothetical protein